MLRGIKSFPSKFDRTIAFSDRILTKIRKQIILIRFCCTIFEINESIVLHFYVMKKFESFSRIEKTVTSAIP